MGFLPVGVEHQIYFEDVGKPANEALFFLHGGPGSGTEEKHRSQFDLAKYRVILFDQRGCGKSQSTGELFENSTDFIVKDLELLRKRLKIEKLSLLGSSWGAVPAAKYAAENSERINSLILKSPFLARKKDFSWSYSKEGVAKLLPKDWQIFAADFGEEDALIARYHKEIVENSNKEFILRWLNWEGAQYFYSRPNERMDFTNQTLNPYWQNVARIQAHYAKNHFFVSEEGILPWIKKIATTQIKGICIQGANDIITPPAESAELKKMWPELDYRLIEKADHKIPDEELLKL
jgi:proline iminopeptidase